MYCIIGYRYELDYISYEESQILTVNEVVATFDTMGQAEDYIQKSLLEAAKKPNFKSDVKRGKYKFKRGSFLRHYDSAAIEKYEKTPLPPHNPSVLEL